MSPAKPVYVTTPDGVKRELRFTFGARKRIVDRFGCGLLEAIQKYDMGALPEILYSMMYDENGNPPKDLDLAKFVEWDALEDAPALMVTVMDAMNKGRATEKEKNEAEARIRKGMQEQAERLIGFSSGPSPISASEDEGPTSGSLPNESLTPSVNDTEKSESLTTTAQA